MPTNTLDWGIRIGIPADFWVLKEKMVGEFIKANKLSAVTHEAMRVDAHPISEKLATGICQQRCRRFIKKIIQLYPGLRLLPGSHSIA